MQDLAFHELLEHLKNISYSPYINFFFWLMILDIVTGYIKAFKTKRFDSKVGTMGLIRHFIVFVVILLVAMYARSESLKPYINQIKKDNARKIGQLLVNIDQKDKVEIEVKEKDDATN